MQLTKMPVAASTAHVDFETLWAFMQQQPFYYAIYAQLRSVWVDDNESLPTYACVSYTNKGFTLYLNRELWATLSVPERVFLLSHECAHLALGHVANPDPQRTNHALRNVAQDIVINEMLRELRASSRPLVDDGWWLDKVNGPNGEPCMLGTDINTLTWQDIYDRITLAYNNQPDKSPGADGQGGFDDHDKPQPGDEFGDAPGDKQEGQARAQALGDLVRAQADEMAANAVRACQQRGTESQIPQAIQIHLHRAPPPYSEQIRKLLQQFVASSRDSRKRLTWRRFSRRLGSVAKGRLSARRPKVAVAIDTSGSMMGTETLDELTKAIAALCEVAESVDAVAGDTAVAASATGITPKNIAHVLPGVFKGGGGTTLQPLLDHLAKEGHYDCVVLLTDGFHETLNPLQPTVALTVPGGVPSPGLAQSLSLVEPGKS